MLKNIRTQTTVEVRRGRAPMTHIRIVFCSIAIVVALFGGATAMLLAKAGAPDARQSTAAAVVAFDLEDYATSRP